MKLGWSQGREDIDSRRTAKARSLSAVVPVRHRGAQAATAVLFAICVPLAMACGARTDMLEDLTGGDDGGASQTTPAPQETDSQSPTPPAPGPDAAVHPTHVPPWPDAATPPPLRCSGAVGCPVDSVCVEGTCVHWARVGVPDGGP